MYVMTPYTSLCWLEKEAMYKQFNVDRGRKDHWAMYPCPAKIPVVYIPDPNQPAGGRPDLKGQKPHENQVLQTIMVRTPPQFLTWPGHGGGDTPIMTAGQRYSSAFAMTDFDADDLAELSDGTSNTFGWKRDLEETLHEADKKLKEKVYFSESKTEKLLKQIEGLDRREAAFASGKQSKERFKARLSAAGGFGGRQLLRVSGGSEAALAAPVLSPTPEGETLGE